MKLLGLEPAEFDYCGARVLTKISFVSLREADVFTVFTLGAIT